jgi:hypothetical protein
VFDSLGNLIQRPRVAHLRRSRVQGFERLYICLPAGLHVLLGLGCFLGRQDTEMGSTTGDGGIAVAPPQPRGLGAEIEFQLHLYPAVACLNFGKLTYRLANVPRGVTLYESHLSEVNKRTKSLAWRGSGPMPKISSLIGIDRGL